MPNPPAGRAPRESSRTLPFCGGPEGRASPRGAARELPACRAAAALVLAGQLGARAASAGLGAAGWGEREERRRGKRGGVGEEERAGEQRIKGGRRTARLPPAGSLGRRTGGRLDALAGSPCPGGKSHRPGSAGGGGAGVSRAGAVGGRAAGSGGRPREGGRPGSASERAEPAAQRPR